MEVIFAYIPVVHAGVLSFLREYPNRSIWLLDNEVGKIENPYLERDLRALPASDIRTELLSLGFNDVNVVSPKELSEKIHGVTHCIVPDDEITKFFLEKYIPDFKVEYVPVFLRWTKKISTTEFEVAEDRKITEEQFAVELIKKLETEATQSPDWWRQIAAAVVREGDILSLAQNKHYPSQHALSINGDPRSNLDAGQGPGIYTSIHAEANAIAHVAREGKSSKGADMYVTTFPCPTCARLMVEAGIRRVFYKQGYSVLDAEEILKQEGIEIILVKDDSSQHA